MAAKTETRAEKSQLSDEVARIKAMLERVAVNVEDRVDEAAKNIASFSAQLEGKAENELRFLHTIALHLESDAKKDLTILRQRAANLATEVDAKAEVEVIMAKIRLAECIAWLKELENKLFGASKDIYGSRYGD
jgi:hypothetical protein